MTSSTSTANVVVATGNIGIEGVTSATEFRLAGWFTTGTGNSVGTYRMITPTLFGSSELRTASNLVWDGGRGTEDWDAYDGHALDQSNWNLNQVPSALLVDSLTFSGSAQTTTNNTVSGLTVGSITFAVDAGRFVNVGNPLTLTGAILSESIELQTIGHAITFSSGDREVAVAAGGTLVLDGDISGSTGRMLKTGGGTLVVGGSSSASYRIGAAGASPTDGGTVVLGRADSAGTAQIQLDYGTLRTDVEDGITLVNGVSLGGRTGAVAVFGGSEPLTFSGSSSFFRAAGTSGELRVDVINATEFSGIVGPSAGSGSATGITFGGAGRLTFSGDASLLNDRITLQDSLELFVENAVGGSLVVGADSAIGGNGTIAGDLTFSGSGSIIFDPLKTLKVGGAAMFEEPFGIANLVGLSSSTPDGTYQLIAGTVASTNLLNLGPGNAFPLGGGRSAYFTIGSLNVVVVPEPHAAALAGPGLSLAWLAHRQQLAGRQRRGRKRHRLDGH